MLSSLNKRLSGESKEDVEGLDGTGAVPQDYNPESRHCYLGGYQRFSLGSAMRCFRLGSAASLVCRTATPTCSYCCYLVNALRLCVCVRACVVTVKRHSLTLSQELEEPTHAFKTSRAQAYTFWVGQLYSRVCLLCFKN